MVFVSAVVDEHLCLGARVQLQGLSRTELNGIVAVVLPPAGDDEARSLAEAGRMKVSHYPKALSLRPENLVPAPEPDFATPPLPFTALEIVRFDAALALVCEEAARAGEGLRGLDIVGAMSAPEDFAEALWQVYGAVPPAFALPADFASRILDTPGHHLYWLGLEQVGHHLLIEACDSVWRGYQALAHIEGGPAAPPPEGREGHGAKAFQSFGGVIVEACASRQARGYKASTWASPPDPSSVPEPPPESVVEIDKDADEGQEKAVEERAAWELWGGGRDLNRGEMAKVLDLVFSLKEQAQVLAQRLCEGLGEHLEAEEVSAWARDRLESSGEAFTLTPSRPGTPTARQGQSDQVFIFSAPGMEPPCDLNLPTRLAFPFMRSYARLTGEFPAGAVFLKMLEFINWEALEREDGGRVGWTLRECDLRRR